MLEMGVSIALILCAVGWLAYRRRSAGRPPTVNEAEASDLASSASALPTDRSLLEEANDAAAERLWNLAYATPFRAESSDTRAHDRVRENIVAVLEVDELDSRYFPRRPALLPQLLQAVDDPSTAADRLSRMIAHDPVLTADVLRMSNSSFHRTSNAPIETIPRAIVVCGIDALRGMLAAAMLRPVFHATRKNFPRLPRMLWDRTERATRAAEQYALIQHPQDRFEAQLLVLLSAIGPLVVHAAIVDVYSRNPHLAPSPALCIELTRSRGREMALRIAKNWQSTPRLAVLEKSSNDSLRTALLLGELVGTLSFLESQTVISAEDREKSLRSTGIPYALLHGIWSKSTNNV